MVVLIFGTSKRSKNVPNSVGNIANLGKNPGKNIPNSVVNIANLGKNPGKKGPDVGEKLHFEVVAAFLVLGGGGGAAVGMGT